MTRRPYQSLLTNEDRLTYRMWIRPVAVVYGSLALLMFGVATIRLVQSNDHDTANVNPSALVSVANDFNHDR